MGLTIDPRLLEPNGEGEIVENFNRTLDITDKKAGRLIGNTTNISPKDVAEALNAGKLCVITHTDTTLGAVTFCSWSKNGQFVVGTAIGPEDIPVITNEQGFFEYHPYSITVGLGTNALKGKKMFLCGDSNDSTDTWQFIVEDAVSGGGGNFVVTLSYDETDEEWTADKEPSEIYTAFGEGKNVVIYIDDGVTVTAAGVLFADSDEDEIRAVAQMGNIYIEVLYADDAWTVTQNSVLPIASESDEGKVVMVDSNGNYVLGTVSGGGGVSETAIPATVNTPTIGIPTATEVTE
jgi:hypothetical protein